MISKYSPQTKLLEAAHVLDNSIEGKALRTCRFDLCLFKPVGLKTSGRVHRGD